MTREIFFFKNHAENETRRLVPDLFLFFKKPVYEVKASGLQLSFITFGYSKSSSAAVRTRRRLDNTSTCPYVRFDI